MFETPRPALLCLGQLAVYRPSRDLYEQYSRNHPGEFTTELERESNVLPLDPHTRIAWTDMEHASDFGVAAGDVQAAISISTILARLGKSSQVRIGSDYSFEDLRNSPSVVIGAYDNRWTMELTSNLHFAFRWGTGIQEQVPGGHHWTSKTGVPPQPTVDYGIVTRLVDSQTGQFFIVVAGAGPAGTQAAAELVSTPQYLQEGLKLAPKDWNHKNLQLVLQTDLVDSVPGPPHVVASYFW
jgi:hypothetical protein